MASFLVSKLSSSAGFWFCKNMAANKATDITNITINKPITARRLPRLFCGIYIFLSFINNFVKESDVDISSFSNSTIDFLKICKKVYDLKPGRYDWDLHFGNFMKRGNVLVITDPYAGDDFKNTKIKIKEIAKIITMYTKTT